MQLKTQIVNLSSQDRDVMLHPSGAIHILDNASGTVSTSLDPPQLVEGYSKWEEVKTPLESFNYNGEKNNWTAPTLSKKTIFSPPSEENKREIKIDNHESDSINTFIRSGMLEFNFKRQNIYQFSFKFLSATNLESKYSAMFSPYVLLFDKNKKEIARYKFFTKTNIEQEWIISSHQFDVLQGTKYFECGFFLNSTYKMQLMISGGEIHEYVSPKVIDYTPNKWQVSELNGENCFSWESSTGIISSKILGSVEENSKSLNLEIEVEALEKISAGELFINSFHNSLLRNLLHRDYHWGNATSERITIDRWTPKCVEFSSENHIKSANNFSSLNIFVNEEKSELKFNIINWKDSPNFVFVETGEQVFEFEQKLEPGTKFLANIVIQFGDGFECQFCGRAPSGFESTFVMTHHADATTFHTLEAIMHGSSDPKSKVYGKQGIVSNDLRATWSVFSKSISDQIDEWSINRKATNADVEIHTLSADDEKYESIEINTINAEKDLHTLIKSGYYDLKEITDDEDEINFSFTLKNLSTNKENNASISAFVYFLDSEYQEITQTSSSSKLVFGDNFEVSNNIQIPKGTYFAQLSFFVNKDTELFVNISRIKLEAGKIEMKPQVFEEDEINYMVEGLDTKRFTKSMESCGSNVEFVLHTATHYPDDRNAVSLALKEIKKFGARNWIDHSLSSGAPSSGLKSNGWNSNSKFFVMDLFEKEGYEYAWSYIDDKPEGINQLNPSNPESHTPILFQHTSLSSDSGALWQWSTYRPPIKTLFDYVNKENLDNLISQRGISLLHEYFAHLTRQEGYMFNRLPDGNCEITKELNNLFLLVKERVKKGLIWNPTLVEMGDYFRSLEKVKILTTLDGLVIINEGKEVKNFSLWVHNHSDTEKTLKFGKKEIEPIYDNKNEYLIYIFDLPIGKNMINIE